MTSPVTAGTSIQHKRNWFRLEPTKARARRRSWRRGAKREEFACRSYSQQLAVGDRLSVASVKIDDVGGVWRRHVNKARSGAAFL